ncbi:MAG: DUF3536 domain-containing protein [Deltaproteobacteria bacterium]|nr:DUF3536 domain-containing protein [Deltaproteobacteria bacterium]
MEDKYICIHGHFYQPPRENAWIETIEVQDSAHPYHDWNRRITAECYSANAYSRILDEAGRIEKIVNNYEKISFNFGPTLLAWMEKDTPGLYQAILEADQRSAERYSGHGSALAQAYNHMIMPLSNRRDKITQVLWGIGDFSRRFGRDPEGMWLPEAAVDLETLEIMADQGISFTILSPYQAARTRPGDGDPWCDVAGGSIDPKEPYLQKLPGGGSITLFFYDGPISRSLAFENLLKSGDLFAQRLAGGFTDREKPQLLHIATDGESYGHHRRHGDMALAYALHFIEQEGLARLTNYGEFLEKHPPDQEVEIQENTSWSCAHGIERWRSDCGCTTGEHPDWHQAWRQPLRESLDFLRDETAAAYEADAGEYLEDPWKTRDDYIAVVLDRSPASVEGFLNRHAKKARGFADNVRILKLLEMQRHAMFMYTSCGWFFEEISGIETLQIIQYAGRAIQLYHDLFGGDLENRFLEKLSLAKSNVPAHGDGKGIYHKFIRPDMVDLKRIAVHYAISSLFEEPSEKAPLFCYTVTRKEYQSGRAGPARLALGQVEISSRITHETENVRFGAFYVGDHQALCGVSRDLRGYNDQKLMGDLFGGLDRADFTQIMQLLDRAFGGSLYSLKSLFRDGQRKIVNMILENKIADALSVYQHVYDPNVPLMRFLKDSATPIPAPLYASGNFVVNSELDKALADPEMDFEKITHLLREADLAGISLNAKTLEYTLRKNLETKGEALLERPEETPRLENISKGLELVHAFPFDVNLRRLQDILHELKEHVYPDFKERADRGEADFSAWTTLFEAACERLNLQAPS